MLWVAWGITREKDLGPAYPLICPNCRNEAAFRLTKRRHWGLFFVIPFPYKTTYWLTCPVCGVGWDLSKSERQAASELIEPTEQFIDGALDPETYAETLSGAPERLGIATTDNTADAPGLRDDPDRSFQ